MVLATILIVVLRYGFAMGSIALQEAIHYMHATVFLLGASYTLQQDEHVRVDIFYQRFTPRQQAWVNAIGCIVLLLPFCVFLMVCGWQFFLNAWHIKESSSEPGGLPWVYLLKGLIPLASALLTLQGLGLLLRCACQLVVKDTSAWN